MGDAVFDFQTQLCEGLIISVGLEDGIITKSLLSSFLTDNLSLDDSLKKRGLLSRFCYLVIFLFFYLRNYSAKACLPIVIFS